MMKSKTRLVGLVWVAIGAILFSGCGTDEGNGTAAEDTNGTTAEDDATADGGGETDAEAEGFPQEPVELVVAYPPGGLSDISARLVANGVEATSDVTMPVRNVEGGGGVVGIRQVLGTEPDGYTVGLGNTGLNTIVPHVEDAGFEGPDDYVAVAHFGRAVQGLIVQGDSPWQTIDDLVAHAEENPDDINIAVAGTATNQAMLAERFKAAADVEVDAVPLGGGGEVKPALLGGHVDAAIIGLPAVAQEIESGDIRVLMTFDQEADPEDPLQEGVPTATESGYDIVASDIFFGYVPVGTPDAVVEELRDIFVTAVNSDEYLNGAEEAGLRPPTTEDQESLTQTIEELTDIHADIVARLGEE